MSDGNREDKTSPAIDAFKDEKQRGDEKTISGDATVDETSNRGIANDTRDATAAFDSRDSNQDKTATHHSGDDFSLIAETKIQSKTSPRPDETQDDVHDNTLEFSENGNGLNEASGTIEFGASWTVASQGKQNTKSLVGSTIGEYQILDVLGRGGMGIVYKAKHVTLNRLVAIKMILAGSHANEDQIKRFMSEARAVAGLQHPNIVQIFDIGEHEELPYFSLEYVDGASLEDVLREESASPNDAAKMVASLAEAMQYAHDAGILHRDIKPANVLISKDGIPKITDFGLAKQIQNDDEQTKTGMILGTPGYMPPEQATGQKDIGPSADQYSLGALLYRMLSGRAPFVSSKVMDTIMQVIESPPVPLRQLDGNIPKDLETICLKTLAKKPAQRYANCSELAAELNRFLNGEPIIARPVSQTEKMIRWCKTKPQIAIPTFAAALSLIAVAIISTWSYFAVTKERDNAIAQEEIAAEQSAFAQQQMRIAQDQKEEADKSAQIAREQSKLVVKTIQDVLTVIDSRLEADPNLAETRIKVLEAMSETWDKLDVGLASDKQSTAIPTLMATRFKLTFIFSSLGRNDLAAKEVHKVYDLAKQRIEDKNGSDAARENLVKIALQHALLTERAENMSAAKPYLDEAVSVARDIIANPKPEESSPAIYKLRATLSTALNRLAVHHLKLGELEKSGQFFKESGAIQKAILDSIADDGTFNAESAPYQKLFRAEMKRSIRQSALANATVLMKTGKPKAGLREFESLVKGMKSEADANPNEMQNEIDYGRFSGNLGYYAFKLGEIETGKKYLKESELMAGKYAAKFPKVADHKVSQSLALYRLTNVNRKGDDAAKNLAKSQIETCVGLRKGLWELDNDNLKYRSLLMLALAKDSQVEKAIALAEKMASGESLSGQYRINLARCYAECSLHNSEQQVEFQKNCIREIQKAVDSGYGDWFELRTEPDLEPVRASEAFQKILKTVTPPEYW